MNKKIKGEDKEIKEGVSVFAQDLVVQSPLRSSAGQLRVIEKSLDHHCSHWSLNNRHIVASSYAWCLSGGVGVAVKRVLV